MKAMMMAVLGLTLAGQVAADTIYRCEIDGRLVFSQQPCEEDAERVEIEQREPRAGEARASSMHDPNYADRVRLERRIDRHQARIRNLQRSRDQDLSALRARQRRAMNNQAGATWLQAIAAEMQATADSYDSRIQVEQREIDRLQQRMAEL